MPEVFRESDQERVRGRFLGALGGEGRRSRRLMSESDMALREFDAGDAARESARAQFETFREDLGRDIGDLRGELSSVGRLRTGYGEEDEDRLVRGGIRNLNRSIAQRAVQAAGINARVASTRAQVAEGARGRYLDFLAGTADRVQASENARRRQRGNIYGAIGSLVGGVAGLPGGPAGVAAGAQIGGSAGRAFT